MERLAEILGSLYFLNPLCKPGGTDWRQQGGGSQHQGKQYGTHAHS